MIRYTAAKPNITTAIPSKAAPIKPKRRYASRLCAAVDPDLVFAILERAANAGTRCPSNPELRDRLRVKSIATPSRIISDLERAGRIKVKRTRWSRTIEIVATGARTA